MDRSSQITATKRSWNRAKEYSALSGVSQQESRSILSKNKNALAELRKKVRSGEVFNNKILSSLNNEVLLKMALQPDQVIAGAGPELALQPQRVIGKKFSLVDIIRQVKILANEVGGREELKDLIDELITSE